MREREREKRELVLRKGYDRLYRKYLILRFLPIIMMDSTTETRAGPGQQLSHAHCQQSPPRTGGYRRATYRAFIVSSPHMDAYADIPRGSISAISLPRASRLASPHASPPTLIEPIGSYRLQHIISGTVAAASGAQTHRHTSIPYHTTNYGPFALHEPGSLA